MWPISNQKTKNESENFEIRFLIWNEKTNFKNIFHFSILIIELKNEKQTKKFFEPILIQN